MKKEGKWTKKFEEGFSTRFHFCWSCACLGFGVKGRLGGMVELEGKEWRLGNGEGWDEHNN